MALLGREDSGELDRAAPSFAWRAARIGTLRRAFAASLDFLLPPRCGACAEPVAGGAGLCAECWARVEFIGPPLCDRLGLPLPYDAGPGALSPQALQNPPAFDRARGVAAYRGPARALVHALKFHDRLELVDMMAGMMARTGAQVAAGSEIVVPVPLHRRRLLGRRFNQSALLAAGIARRMNLPHDAMALQRIRPTRQQLGLDAAERRRNVARAFAVAPSGTAAIAGRRVLLVDDVFTTGATVEACTKALRKAGATGVDVLVFAMVVRGETAAI
ncbi:ComF family protein [Lutibaculum baratangense]|uniref:Competence protein F-like protein n=1 Tax=Lutibaculum baratangense AMV1 TaxID=631454 RepID=V4TCR2_9HYPH|nr:ComF family protein [Lutibaculum baratangense]ESR24088.1 Competence protein F-like protein [Lutibaculum baratangense AMV1]